VERQDGGAARPGERREHVAHAVVGLVNDAVVIPVERRLGVGVGRAADVHRPTQPFALFAAPQSKFIRVAPKIAHVAKLLRPRHTGVEDLDRQAEGHVEGPDGAARTSQFLRTRWRSASSRDAQPHNLSRLDSATSFSRPSPLACACAIHVFLPASFAPLKSTP
jgi:hypothetical protein